MKRDAALERYFQEGASWDADRVERIERSERRAWKVAGVSWAVTLLALGAIYGLTPLKAVIPFVVRVDNATGIVDVIPSYDAKGSMDEAVSRYFLKHYAELCESYSYASAEKIYYECGAFNAPARNQQWLTLWDKANPLSPLNLYKDGTAVNARVKSVNFFERGNGMRDIATIRFTKAARAGGSGAEQAPTHWIATLQFAYVKPSDDPRERADNPLGFKVVEYRREPEVVGEQAPGPSQPNTGPAAAATTEAGKQ